MDRQTSSFEAAKAAGYTSIDYCNTSRLGHLLVRYLLLITIRFRAETRVLLSLVKERTSQRQELYERLHMEACDPNHHPALKKDRRDIEIQYIETIWKQHIL